MVVAGGAAAIAADVAVDEDVDVELLLLLCEASFADDYQHRYDGKDNDPLGYRLLLLRQSTRGGWRRGRSPVSAIPVAASCA